MHCGAGMNLYKCDNHSRGYLEKMSSENYSSDEIVDYLEILEDIDKKYYLRKNPSISHCTYKDFLLVSS